MRPISIITPWLNASELCRPYAKGLQGAQVIVVDNGSSPEHAAKIAAMVASLGGILIRNEVNHLFARANNQGLAVANGEIVLFLNNDVEARPLFLEQVSRDVQPGGLYGPSLLEKFGLGYLEGWCLAAERPTWDLLGGWDDEYYEGLYWEDNDLCYRAMRLGLKLEQRPWGVWHHSNYTSSKVDGAYKHSSSNMQKFLQRIGREL